MSDLLLGLRSVFSAIRMIATDARVRRLAIAPFVINVLLVLVGLPLFIWLATTIGGGLVPGTGELSSALRVVVQILAVAVFVVVGIIAMLVVARIVAAPLMSRLSEAVEQRELGDRFVPRRTTLRDDVSDVGRGAAFAFGRLLLFILLYPLVLLLGLVPAAGPVLASAGTFLYGAFVLSLDFSEPVFERHLPGFRRRLRHVSSRPMLYLGFGAVAVAMALVPFANLAVLPVCVAAATITFLRGRRTDAAQL